jgi:hypothetical protein
MGQMSVARREEVWCALADFLDDERIDYRLLSGVDIEQLEEIFFSEVAFYCGPYYMSVTPPMGEGFFHNDVIEKISAIRERRKNSIIARVMQKILLLYWRNFFKEEWKKLVKGLEEHRYELHG